MKLLKLEISAVHRLVDINKGIMLAHPEYVVYTLTKHILQINSQNNNIKERKE